MKKVAIQAQQVRIRSASFKFQSHHVFFMPGVLVDFLLVSHEPSVEHQYPAPEIRARQRVPIEYRSSIQCEHDLAQVALLSEIGLRLRDPLERIGSVHQRRNIPSLDPAQQLRKDILVNHRAAEKPQIL